MWDILSRDLKLAARGLRARPGFAFVAVLTLAVGIGASTAIFSLVEAVLLRPLPFPEASRLVSLWETAEREELELRGLSFPMLEDLAASDEVFDAVAGIYRTAVNLTGDEEPERVVAELASPEYLRLLGTEPLLGRLLGPDDDVPGANLPPVVLSEALWRRRFGASPEVLGQILRVNEVAATVVGVASGGGLTGRAELFLPLRGGAAVEPGLGSRRFERRVDRWLDGIARRRAGVSMRQLDAWIDGEVARLRADHPGVMERRGLLARPLEEELLGDVRGTALLLMAAVGLVLLIACANLAGLLFARSVGREREMALRRALGATRLQLARQLLTESLLLSALGGGLGVLLALWVKDLLRASAPLERLPAYVGLEIDARALAFAVLTSAVTALLFGGGPAFAAVRSSLAETLRGQRPPRGGWRLPGRELLVAAQVALALVLTIASGLLLKSLVRELEIDPGFRGRDLYTLRLQLPERYDGGGVARFAEQAVERLGSLPGVASVALGSDLPLVDGYSAFMVRTEESLRADPDERYRTYHHEVTPSFFETLGIRLVAGRAFSYWDRADAPPVVVVSEKLAERAWPGEGLEAVVGKKLLVGSTRNPLRTVVGVVADVRYRDLVADPAANPDDPDLYLPLAQSPSRGLGVALATKAPGPALAGAVRRELRALDASLPVYEMRGMGDILASELALSRLAGGLLAVFGGVAVALAGLGLYGLLAHLVAERSRDIGIRMALGASAHNVEGLVVGKGLLLVLSGCLAGLAVALALGRFLQSFLYRLSPTDAPTWLVASGLLLAVAVVASYLPARRASRVSPASLLGTRQ